MQKAPFTDDTIRRSVTSSHYECDGLMLSVLEYDLEDRVCGTVFRPDCWILNASLGPRAPAAHGRFADSRGDMAMAVGELMWLGPQSRTNFVCNAGTVRTITCAIGGTFADRLLQTEDERDPPVGEAVGELDLHSAQALMYLRMLADELQVDRFARPTMLRSLAEIGFVEALRASSRQSSTRRRGGLAPWQMRYVRERLFDQADVAPTIAELALGCRISSRHLIREFKRSTGMTIGQMMRTTQLERAKRMLREDATSIGDIATRLGFRHPSSFIAAFRGMTGQSPLEYRRSGGC